MNLAAKIKKVMKETGCSPTEACEALQVDVDAATIASLAQEEKVVTLETILEGGKVIAAQVLVDIVDDTTAENKDRIAAAKIILTGAGELPNIGIGAYEERFKRFDLALKEHEAKVSNVIDIGDGGTPEINRLLKYAS